MSAIPIITPAFRDDKEEAEYWFSHKEELGFAFQEASRTGTLGRGTVKALLFARNKPMAIHPINHKLMFDLGDALGLMKLGRKVSRSEWNNVDMWLSLTPGHKAVPANGIWSPNNRRFAETLPTKTIEVAPSITMKTSDDKIIMGWTPSQVDLLAEDYFEIHWEN